MNAWLVCLASCVAAMSDGPAWERVATPAGVQGARLRGVGAEGDGSVWATGSQGTVLHRGAGGGDFERVRVPGYEGADFRDVAIAGGAVVILAIGEGQKSQILRSTDRGRSWKSVYRMSDPAGFLDALAFWDAQRGLALGDPLNGRFTVLETGDGGATWTPVEPGGMPEALAREGAFAASGTCLAVGPGGLAWFCTGGAGVARVFRSTDWGRTWLASAVPIPAENRSSGLFGVAFRDAEHGIAVGGDYQQTQGPHAAVATTSDGGQTWSLAGGNPPTGLCSAAIALPAGWLVVGPSGSHFSNRAGDDWKAVPGSGAFHAADTSGDGTVWAAGENGSMGRWRGPARP